jgi:hypothetical protein
MYYTIVLQYTECRLLYILSLGFAHSEPMPARSAALRNGRGYAPQLDLFQKIYCGLYLVYSSAIMPETRTYVCRTSALPSLLAPGAL